MQTHTLRGRFRRGLLKLLRSSLEACVADPKRVLTRAIEVSAYASDASLYRLMPRAVVQPTSEEEVRALLHYATREKIPLTFRTAGTSLSGQAVTDGLLIDLSKHWSRLEVLDGGARVRLQPGIVGGRVNAELLRYGRRIGPDPASIDACMIGGILANNSSGMCCGTRENAYQTLDSMRFMLADGLVLDTGQADVGDVFRARAANIYLGLLELRDRVRADSALVAKIRAKYRIKNTMGYALNAFLDHDRAEQILAHLIIGSEGTLAFISEAVLRTLPDYPHKRAGLLYFADAARAFEAVAPLEASGARAIEFMDEACLRTMPDQPAACALLVEYQAENLEIMARYRAASDVLSAQLDTLTPPRFTEDFAERAALWKLRKNLLPAAGATKRSGETVIIEDIAVPLPQLPQATAELQKLLIEYEYDRALVFGHAKDGNCHFVLTQSFNEKADIDRYDRFMEALAVSVIAHQGSLKAEHGTGRNMAPFVEAEWGREAYAIMRALKALIDPQGVLNPGVILNADPKAHVADLKDLPAVEEEIDRCIECGFCEPVCPSRRLTLTPRQRIVVRREMARLRARGGEAAKLAELEQDFQYAGIETCAADGMCSTACPVKIDTGSLVKRLRAEQQTAGAKSAAQFFAENAGATETMARLAISAAHGAELVFGSKALALLTRGASAISGVRLPEWSSAMPRSGHAPRIGSQSGADLVYVPSCLVRIMGRPRDDESSVADIFLLLAERSGVPVFVPESRGQCCGLAWGSKGFAEEHARVLGALVDLLWEASDHGRRIIAVDATSCLQSLKTSASLLDGARRVHLEALRFADVLEVARGRFLPKLSVKKLDRRVVLHPTCAARKLELAGVMKDLAEKCAREVYIPLDLSCCAMAGDRGLLYPELTAAATFKESAEVASISHDGCYSNNLSCELGMSRATGSNYRSLLYLLEEASR